jgi:hypothetical protein
VDARGRRRRRGVRRVGEGLGVVVSGDDAH